MNIRTLLAVSVLTASPVAPAADGLFPFVPDLEGEDCVVDMSALVPAPAGKDGFVRAEGEWLVTDRGVVRMHGINLTGAANFPTHEQADRLAQRLSRFGFNCVRMHYFDVVLYPNGFFSVPEPGIFADDPKTTCRIDEGQRDRLEYLVAALKRRGVYSDLNLHVHRQLDERDGFPATHKGARGLDYYYGPIIEKEKEFAKDLLTHVNPYTGLSFADDPAVAMIELNNENGLFQVWPAGTFDDEAKFHEVYRTELTRQWNAWLDRRYGGKPPCGHIPYLKARMPGPAYPASVTNDFYRFLADTDSSYFRTMREYLRKDLGVKCVVYGTQLDYVTPHTLAETCDAVDVHLYGRGSPDISVPYETRLSRKGPVSGVRWRLRAPEPLIASAKFDVPYDEDFVPHRATMRVKDRPFLCTESSEGFPNWHAAGYQPFLRSLAAFQGWAGVFAYTWNFQRDLFPDHTPFFWSLAARTDCLAHFPAVAAIYLRGDVRCARERVFLNDAKEDFFARLFRLTHRRCGFHSSPTRITDGKFRATEVLLRGVGVDLAGTSPAPTPLDPARVAEMESGLYRSDTGELTLDRREKGREFYTVRTPNVKVFSGFATDRIFDLGDGVTFTSPTNRLGWCTASLTSLDGTGFGPGARILLAVTGYAQNGGAHYRDLGDGFIGGDDCGTDLGRGKTEVEGVRSRVTLPGTGWSCRAVGEDGRTGRSVPVATDGNATTVETSPEYGTVWYELRRNAAPAGRLGIGLECLDRDLWDLKPTLPALKELGVSRGRLQSGWAKTEREKGVYDFAWLDEAVAGVRAAGVEPWISLSYGNPLYAPEGMKARADGIGLSPLMTEEGTAAWRRYVRAIVTRFKDRVKVWEVWNEPECGIFFKVRPGKTWRQDYLELLKITAEEIRAADPSARVAAGATAGTPGDDQIAGLFEDGLGAYADIYTFHGYGAIPETFDRTSAATYAMIRRNAPKVEIWRGEAGLPSAPSGRGALSNVKTSEAVQCRWMARHLVRDLADPSIDFTSYFHLFDFEHFSHKYTYHYGVLRDGDCSKKPSFAVLRRIRDFFDDGCCVPDRTLGVSAKADDVVFHAFRRNGSAFVAYVRPELPSDEPVVRETDVSVFFGNSKERWRDPVVLNVVDGTVTRVKPDKWSFGAHLPYSGELRVFTEAAALKPHVMLAPGEAATSELRGQRDHE